ncbi:MAG: rane protein [Rhodoglobus sp.]|nr:rane protein [Rhodoglobus sp.]
MYMALWRILPGPLWLRLFIVLVLVAAVLSALVLWVFPAVLPFVSTQDATVQQ